MLNINHDYLMQPDVVSFNNVDGSFSRRSRTDLGNLDQTVDAQDPNDSILPGEKTVYFKH